MADASHTNDELHGHLEGQDFLAPRTDYGLTNEDGFEPSKYDFYNSAYHTTSKAFVVRIDENDSAAFTKTNEPTHLPDTFDVNTPPSLSPIEELEDDLGTRNQERNSTSSRQTIVNAQNTASDDSTLAIPEKNDDGLGLLEKTSELLFCRQHLQTILADEELSIKFTDFLRIYRPNSVPILAYYLDAVKALKTIRYAEAIMKGLEPIPGHAFTAEANSATMAWVVEDKADRALAVLTQDCLPAFVAYIYVRTVDVALVDRVTGRDNSTFSSIADGLAEVFVLSDPSRPDNPIVFTSEEFHRMTGYSRSEILGRNCRMLGGHKTSPLGVSRFRASLDAEREHCEVLLNYRKDGSPFLNLIMCVPLRDQSGKVRYYLGAQLDITDLLLDCTGLPSLAKLIKRQKEHRGFMNSDNASSDDLRKDEFEQLSQVFNPKELEQLLALRQRQQLEAEEDVIDIDIANRRKEDLSVRTPPIDLDSGFQIHGGGSAPPLGYYKTYVLVRPYPSLRILFASPDLRAPGILQSHLMGHVGGSTRVRDDLSHALEVGRKVTAKVQWLSKGSRKSQARWIHCTPLLGINDAVGVWMVILVDDEDDDEEAREAQGATVSNMSSGKRLDPDYMAQALPWNTERQEKLTDRSRNHADGSTRSIARRPLYRLPTDTGEPGPIVRAGPKIAGKAYSFTSDSDRGLGASDLSSAGADRSRPASSSSSAAMPLQSAMQPKVKYTGRPSLSMDADNARKPPIHMPYQPSKGERGESDGILPVRKTYKSLSPYGVLFED